MALAKYGAAWICDGCGFCKSAILANLSYVCVMVQYERTYVYCSVILRFSTQYARMPEILSAISFQCMGWAAFAIVGVQTKSHKITLC